MTVRRAVLIVPPAADMVAVEALRRRFDPLAAALPAHATVVFPFESDISSDALRKHLESATRGTRCFRLELRGLTCAQDHYLFMQVARGAEELVDLHRRLYSGPLHRFASARQFTPHVTVGRFATMDECATAMQESLSQHVRVRTIAPALRVYDLVRAPYSVEFEVGWS